MKKFIFLLTFMFLPTQVLALECTLPSVNEFEINGVQKITKEFFRQDGYLILFYYYDIEDPVLKDKYSKFNFESTLKLAKHYWGEQKDLDVKDLLDENGKFRPYVLVEFGGTVKGNFFQQMKSYAKIGTCYDRQINETNNIFFVEYGEYEQILNGIKDIFIPVLALEEKEYQE